MKTSQRLYSLLLWIVLPTSCWYGCRDSKTVKQPAAKTKADGAAKIAFTDVTAASGLNAFRYENGAAGDFYIPESKGSGGGFFDYDGDGWIDVVLVGGGTWSPTPAEPVPALWLYRNNGDGTFTFKNAEAGLSGLSAYGFGIAAADYDNDGDQDFYFTTLGKNMLFRNDGGVFTEVAEDAGVAGEDTWSSSAVFFDADNDGWVDLYYGNYIDWSPETDLWCTLDGETKSYCTPEIYEGVPGRFFRNNGDGTFIDRTVEAGFLPAPGKTLGITLLDFNRDGWPDLMVANDTQPDLLYVNNGDGTFTEKGALSGIAYDENGRARAGMGIDAGVVDTTGEETIFVANFSKEMIGVYRHAGNGLFIDRAAVSKIGRPSLMRLTFSVFLFDVELDGDLDLFAGNGHVQQDIEVTQDGITYRQPPLLFVNDGNGNFHDESMNIGGPLAQAVVCRGAAYADYDRDGDLDILITDNTGPAYLWRNDLEPGYHFLRVHLEGRQSNRDGIGARIIAKVGRLRMERQIRTGSSFLSQSEKTATFGLGQATQVDSLIVYWPSQRIDRFAHVDGDREVLLVEGSTELIERPMAARKSATAD